MAPRKPLGSIGGDVLKQTLGDLADDIAPRRSRAVAVLPVELHTADDYVAEIGRLWRESHERFVQIGEHLDQARERLEHGQWIAMVNSHLPFGRQVAFQLMAAAKAIKTGIVPAELAPPSYTTVYAISTLTDEERQAAIDQGVIRPDVTRAKVEAFKRSLRAPAPPVSPQPAPVESRRAALEAELERLLLRVAEIEAELSKEN